MTGLKEAFDRLDRFVERKREVMHIPGIAVAVTDRMRLLRVSTYGFADLVARTPVTPEVLFEIGSIGKSFTSICLLQLYEEGRVDLHRPVAQYLPWFEIRSPYGPITLHHLLSHTAAITHGPELPGEARCEVWALREAEATAPPGTYYHYSDSGYKTLGVVLEEVLGKPYGEIVQERILDPLGMSATVPVITNETRRRLAVGYEPFYDDRPPPPDRPLAPATWLEHAEGAGSIASTPEDMATYLRMLMNAGQGPSGRILSEESFKLMIQRVIKAEEEGDGSFYGYGLGIWDLDGHTVIGHGGGMVGYYSYMLADLDEGLGVIVLTNGPGDRSDEEIAWFALRLLRAAIHRQDLPPVPPVDPTRVEEAAAYAGTYRGEERTFTLVAEGDRLLLCRGEERITLEQRGPDRFYVDHRDFDLFLLRFGREKGEVVEALHGPDWYVNERYAGPTAFDRPQEWNAYVGHYRSHNPWLTNFRIVLRKGGLVLIYPSGDEEPLTPLGGGVFRVGEDERSPERIRFQPVLNGQALRANLSCVDYCRTFTR